MAQVTFRPAQPGDEAVIWNFVREMAVYEKLEDQFVATEADFRQELEKEGGAQVLFAQAEGEIVGYALFFTSFSTFLARRGIYLEDLIVLPRHRGKGYGKALLRELARLTAERGYGRLEWSCLDWNQPSIDFYLSVGAQPLEEWTMYRLTGEALHALAQGG